MKRKASVVYVVDDDPSVRESLRRLLGSVGLDVRTFESAQSFLDTPEDDVTACLVLDLRLPGLSGLDLQARLAGRSAAPIPIVFLSAYADVPTSVRAMKAGAMEFLTKPYRPKDLTDAVTQALERHRAVRAQQRELADLRRRYETLTMREREVMAGVVAGLRTKDIANEFGTREDTVKEQRAQVMTKMAAESIADLVRMATELGTDPRKGG
jgi:FixJ family two-component response regulator